MESKEFYILAMKMLALGGAAGAALVELFASEENRKHERVVGLLLSSIAYSLIAISLQ